METTHKLALYVSYYLARFNSRAYSQLGFGNQGKTHKEIGRILNVNPHTIKNMRDEFDPIYGFRKGWHQRAMSPSRVAIVRAMEELDESGVREIVLEILQNTEIEDIENLANVIEEDKPTKKQKGVFILRGPTGKLAEEYFQNNHQEISSLFNGTLIDKRDLGGGFDFELINGDLSYFIEIKGLSEISGGILLTNKEWNTAKEKRNNYFLVIISALKTSPVCKVIRNPANILNPKRNVYTTVQVTWGVSTTDLRNVHS